MKNFRKELELKREKKIDKYKFVGAEIKRRRIQKSQTLFSVSEDICSLSYACKIERNAIIPNETYLYMLCEKVGLTKDKVNVLIDSTKYLEETIKAYYSHDLLALKKIGYAVLGLDNYRMDIINLIIAISNENYAEAHQIKKELNKILNSMDSSDLYVFGVFSGIADYYLENYLEAKETFDSLEMELKDYYYLDSLCKEYYFYLSYKVSSNNTIQRYNDIIEILFKENNQIKYNNVNYLLAIYYIKNSMINNYYAMNNSLFNSTQRNNIKILLSFIQNKKLDSVPTIKNKGLLALYYSRFDSKKFLSIIRDIDDDNTIDKVMYRYLKYAESKYTDDLNLISDYLQMVLLPTAIKSLDKPLILAYYSEWAMVVGKTSKYKRFYEEFFLVMKAISLAQNI